MQVTAAVSGTMQNTLIIANTASIREESNA